MDAVKSATQCKNTPESSIVALVITTIIWVCVLFSAGRMDDYYTVKNNWGEYRCQTEIMLFASFFGHDTSENLQFCLGEGFNARAAVSVNPFYGILSGFTKTLMTLLSSINSIRMVFATLVGSISQVFSEFSSRVQMLMYRIQATAARMRFLMKRVFAMMYSILFMGMSGIKAGTNFVQTPPWKFVTWMACFPPETPILLEGKGLTPMKDVIIGDTIDKDIRVTGTVSILGDGQKMFKIDGCSVSASHYIMEDGHWILSKDSARAVPEGAWTGGTERPLTCLVTSTHRLPIGNLEFSDYHETEDADRSTMAKVLKKLNGSTTLHLHKNYITGVDPNTDILLEDGTYCPAHAIRLGTRTRHGVIMAIMLRECSTFADYNGERFGYATAVWKGKSWLRGDVPILEDGKCITFAVYPSAMIETRANKFRDMFEIHEFDIQTDYADKMSATP
jgi:hypothetical protein